MYVLPSVHTSICPTTGLSKGTECQLEGSEGQLERLRASQRGLRASALIMGTQIADFLRHSRGFRKYIFWVKTISEKVFLCVENNANQVHLHFLKWWLSNFLALFIYSVMINSFLAKMNESSTNKYLLNRENSLQENGIQNYCTVRPHYISPIGSLE